MSGSSLRPKPPPIRWLWTVTFSTGRPAAFAAPDCTRAMIWVPVQTSQESGLHMNRAVQRLHRWHARETAIRKPPRTLSPVGKALGDVAFGFGDHAVFFAGGAQIVPDVVGADDLRVGALVPGRSRAPPGPSSPPTCDRRPPRPNRRARRSAARRASSWRRCRRRARPCRRTPGRPPASRISCRAACASMP